MRNKELIMKVIDLIDMLKTFDEFTEVYFTYNYGDHYHTQVAQKVEQLNEGNVIYSEYHSMDKVAVDDEDNDKQTSAILIS